MAINNSSIATDVFSSIRSLLTSTTISIANEALTATWTVPVNAQYNDKSLSRPQIVIPPITFNENNTRFSSTEGQKFISAIIECYAPNTLMIDQIENEVISRIKNNPFSEMELVGLTTQYAFNLNEDQKYHLKTIVLTYDKS